MEDLFAVGGFLFVMASFFLFVLGILWFFLPFAVFGVKGRMDRTLTQLKYTNELLYYIANNGIPVKLPEPRAKPSEQGELRPGSGTHEVE